MLRTLLRGLRLLQDWKLWGAALVSAFGIAFVEATDAWSPPGGMGTTVLRLWFYWSLWLLWPLALLLAFRFLRQASRGRPVRAARSLLGCGLCAAVIWARFIEPNTLRVEETSMPVGCGVRVALVSDLHLGLYVRRGQLEALVRRINELKVDAVLIAGDWSYEPNRDLRSVYAPLAGLDVRPYAVLGNHDEARPGAETLTEPLRQVLGSLGVRLIDGQRAILGRCELVGLGDYSAGSAQRDLDQLPKVPLQSGRTARVVLTHEPVTVSLLPAGFADATLAGHTHGGQVNLPWLTERLLKRYLLDDYVRGAYTLPQTKLFVTTGTGMDHLPFRFRMPPTIDVLSL